jgi:hypothetical protein
VGHPRKKARCRCDTGLWAFVRSGSQVSQAQGMSGQRIRRIIGGAALAPRFGFDT